MLFKFRVFGKLGFQSKSIDFVCPTNLNYFWNGGSLLGIIMCFQVISGILLSLNYNSSIYYAFWCVDSLEREIIFGYLVRFIHFFCSSLFFFFIYLHIGRGIYYGSGRFILVWVSGVVVFLFLMAIGFFGYVLPWGQMSYWGATVITNFCSVISDDLVCWVWGSFSVDYPTLTRFFSFHYLLPFILLGFSAIHIIVLHTYGSGNPMSVSSFGDKRNFFAYFWPKDLVGFIFVFGLVSWLFFIFDLTEAQNFIEANCLVTPEHIQPEWYFLAAYAVLRAVPNKLGGVIALLLFIFVLFIFCFVKMGVNQNPILQVVFFLFICSFICLTVVGSFPVEFPFVLYSQILCFIYFISAILIVFFSL